MHLKNLRILIYSISLLFNSVDASLNAQNAGITINGATLVVPVLKNIIIPGNVKIFAGDSILNNGSIFIAGDFTNNGNSFSAYGNGYEIFNGISVVNGSKNSVFNNLIITPNATLTLAQGMDVKNDWTNNGKFIHGNQIVSFSGTTAIQTINGTATFYDLKLQNKNAVNFGSSNDSIDNSFSNSDGSMDGGTSRVVFKNGSKLMGNNAKKFYDFEILNSAVVDHTSGGGKIHVAHSFMNNGSLTEDTSYTFYFDQSAATETMSGVGITEFGKLVIGNSGFSNPTILNCSADFTIAGGTMSFKKNSVYNGINNTATFSTNACTVSGLGTANFYNVTANEILDFGNGISTINNNLTINAGGLIVANAPFYGTSSTLIYNTNDPALNTNMEWTGNIGTAGLGIPYNVIIQNANNILLAGSRAVPGTLTIGSGNSLDINGNVLTVNTGFLGTGQLKGNAISGLITAGTGTVYFDPAANILKTLTLNTGSDLTLGNALNITAGSSFGTITNDGILNTNDHLTLQSNANGTARIAQSSGNITGNVTVERYMPALRAWRFLSAPFSASPQTINDAWQEGKVNPNLDCSNNQYVQTGYGTEITYNGINGYDPNITGNASIKVWNGTGWDAPGSTYIPITNYPAYCLFVRGDRTICLGEGVNAGSNITILRPKGVLNETGAAGNNVTTTYSGTAGDYMFIGNPYASSVDLSVILSAGRAGTAGIDNNKFWVWDPKLTGSYGVGGYVAYSNGMQVPLGSSATYTAGTIIQGGQAFMVHTNNTNASVNFQQSDKTASETNVFGRQAGQPYPAIYTNLLAPSGDSLALTDGTGAGFGNRFSALVDADDAGKLWNFEENIALVRGESTLSIEFRPVPKLGDTLFYRLYLKQQPYTLQIFSRNLPENLPAKALLADKYLGTQTEINLYDTSLYAFTPNPDTNSYRNRFMLVFNRIEEKTITALKTNNSKRAISGIEIYPNPVSTQKALLHFSNMGKGSYEMILCNTDGKKLLTRKIQHAGGNNFYPLTLNSLWSAGVYIISIYAQDFKKTFNLPLIISK